MHKQKHVHSWRLELCPDCGMNAAWKRTWKVHSLIAFKASMHAVPREPWPKHLPKLERSGTPNESCSGRGRFPDCTACTATGFPGAWGLMPSSGWWPTIAVDRDHAKHIVDHEDGYNTCTRR